MTQRQLSVGEHIEELRSCILRSLVACLLGFGLCFVLAPNTIMGLLVHPITSALTGTSFQTDLITISVQERFMVYTKVCLIAGLILASPYVAWQIWRFIGEGLYPNERKLIKLLFPATVLAFCGGVLFFYFLFLPLALRFLLTFGLSEIRNTITLGAYIGFFASMSLIMGLVFELPIAIVALVKLGICSAEALAAWRRFALLAAVVLGAVLSPGTDVGSQVLIAVPLVLLYEIGLLASALLDGKHHGLRLFLPPLCILGGLALLAGGAIAVSTIPSVRQLYWEWQAKAKDPSKRDEALARLASRGNAVARSALETDLDSPDPSLRYEAAARLAQSGDKRALKVLVGLITSPTVGDHALEALQKATGRRMDRVLQQDAWRQWLEKGPEGAEK